MVHCQRQIVEHQHYAHPLPCTGAKMAQQRELVRQIEIGERLIRQQPARGAGQHAGKQGAGAFSAR